MTVRVPESLAEVTPAWLSEALSFGRAAVRVTSVTVDRRLEGTATKALMRLTYDSSTAAQLPTRICLKGGYSQESSRIIATGAYASEARFYRDVRPLLCVRVPACYFAAVDERSLQGISILEDLSSSGARFGYAPNPLSVDEVARVLELLAGLHAPWWNSNKLDAYPWMEAPFERGSATDRFLRMHSVKDVARWLEEPRARAVPPGITAERVWAALWALQERVGDAPACLLHGDTHLGNLYFDQSGRPGLLDWQTPWRGCWAHDVAYFITSALVVADRRRAERDLLAHYLNVLAGHGVPAPLPSQAWDDYRRYLAYGLFIWIINPREAQPDEVNEPYITRFSAAADDLEIFRLFA